jgi:hypothetical protein
MKYFGGTLAEFEEAVECVHDDNKYGEQYRGIIEYLRKIEHLYKEDFASE